jgi:hypothetical protein
MAAVNNSSGTVRPPFRAEQGLGMMEAVFAIGIVSFGLLSLAAFFAQGMTQLGSSQSDLVAREKAAEAIESVFAARDSQVVTWAQLQNVAGGTGGGGGIFRAGPQAIRDPGRDGLVNTADDGSVQRIATPGPDGQLGTKDDEFTALDGFTREISIRDVGPNVREIHVILTYPSAGATREYRLVALISSFS